MRRTSCTNRSLLSPDAAAREIAHNGRPGTAQPGLPQMIDPQRSEQRFLRGRQMGLNRRLRRIGIV